MQRRHIARPLRTCVLRVSLRLWDILGVCGIHLQLLRRKVSETRPVLHHARSEASGQARRTRSSFA